MIAICSAVGGEALPVSPQRVRTTGTTATSIIAR